MTLPTSEETVVPATDRGAFEKWLMEVHGLDSPWNERRNCFDDWPAHLAFKAWQAGSEQAVRECAEIARTFEEWGDYSGDLETASAQIRNRILSLSQVSAKK